MTYRNALLAVLVAVLAFAVVFFGAVEAWSASLTFAALALLGLVALAPVLAGRSGFPRDPVALAALLLALAALAGLPTSVNRFATLGWLLRLVGFTAVTLVAAQVTPSARAARIALAALLAVTFAATAYGLWVTLTGREVVLYAAKEAYRDSLTGTFINRNHFAALLGLHLFPALGLFVQGGLRRRLLLLLPIAATVLALGLTLSRGGILAAAAATPIFLALLPRHGRRALALAVIALGLAAGALVATNWDRLHARIEESMSPDGEPSAATRLSLWRSTIAAFRSRPITGHGAGTFVSFYPRFREPGVARRVDHAHQEYLELAAEQGVIGIAALAAALGLVGLTLRRALAGAGADRPIVCGLAGGLVALGFAAAVDFPLQIPAVALLAAASIGLAVALGRDRRALPALAPGASRAVACAAALVLLAGLARSLQLGAADRHLGRGEAFFAEPDWDRAGAEFERARAIDRSNPRAFAAVARCEMNRAKFRVRDGTSVRQDLARSALADLAAADRLDPMTADYNLLRAWLYNFLGRRGEAEAEYELAVADDPANANVLYHAASFHLHHGHVDQGLALMGRAIRSWNQFFGGRIEEIHYTVKDPDKVLAIIPEDQPFLVMQYAAFLLGQGDLAASRRAFDRAVARAGVRPEWVIPYAGEIASRHSRADALALYAALPPPSRTAAMEWEIGKLLAGDGRVTEAVTSIAVALARYPTDRELLLGLVIFAGDRPEVGRAVAGYRAAGGAEPGALAAEGQLALSREDPGAALAAYGRALALDPSDPFAASGAARAYALAARAAEESGDCAVASEARALEAASGPSR